MGIGGLGIGKDRPHVLDNEDDNLIEMWKEKRIGKRTYETLTGGLGDIYNKLPENFRTDLKEGISTNIQSLTDWNQKERQTNASGMGPLDPLIAAGWTIDKISSGLSQATGVHKGWTDIGAEFIPFRAVTKTGKLLNAANKVVKSTKLGTNVARKSIATTLTPDPSLVSLTQANIISDFYTIKSDTKKLLDNIGLSLSNNQPLTPAYVSVSTGGPVRDLIKDARRLSSVEPLQARGVKDLELPKDRRSGSKVLGGQNAEAAAWYRKLQQQVQGAKRSISKASTHHMNQLMQQAKAIAEHPNGDAILKALRDKGIPMGDDITNYTTILDLNPKHLKIARVEAAQELYPNIPRKTIDDAFGAGDFKPPQLTINEAEQLKVLKSKDPSWTMDRFLKEVKRDSGRAFGKGQYPTIDLINPDGTKIKWKATTGEEWDGRWKVINEHYGSNIDPKKLYQTKIDPELATYAPDHDFLHNEILNKLPSHKRLKELTKSGEWAKLPESEAIELLEQVSKDSIRSSHKVSKFRYKKMSEYYEKFKLSSQLPDKYKNMKWNNLPTDIQQQYFRDNASKLSSYGSRDITSINEFKFKQLTKKEKAFFGIK
jgi:hypothetical protein